MASKPSVLTEDNLIEKVTGNRLPHYEPYGWHHWPEHPWFAYQFRRALRETQEGGGTVSECFLAASRIVPSDLESWHREWNRVAEFNWKRGLDEEKAGHIRTAINCWLRAADYYRQAEFFLGAEDSRRLIAMALPGVSSPWSTPHNAAYVISRAVL